MLEDNHKTLTHHKHTSKIAAALFALSFTLAIYLIVSAVFYFLIERGSLWKSLIIGGVAAFVALLSITMGLMDMLKKQKNE